MPSFSHEKLVELFRNRGELASALLDAHARIAFPHDHVEQGSIDLSQVVSTEYRADAVIELRNARSAPVAAIIVEVQLHVDHDKEYSWPLYIPALRARRRCPAVLLVLTGDPAVARWARASIALGHPGYSLAPIVIELAELPRVTEPAKALDLPELAVLSVLGHPERSNAIAAMAAVRASNTLSEDQKKLYLAIIRMALPPAVLEALEADMTSTELYEALLDEMWRREHEQDLAQCRNEGRNEGLQKAAIALLQLKLGAVTPEQRAAVEAISDGDRLGELVVSLGAATSDADARAALATLHPGA